MKRKSSLLFYCLFWELCSAYICLSPSFSIDQFEAKCLVWFGKTLIRIWSIATQRKHLASWWNYDALALFWVNRCEKSLSSMIWLSQANGLKSVDLFFHSLKFLDQILVFLHFLLTIHGLLTRKRWFHKIKEKMMINWLNKIIIQLW